MKARRGIRDVMMERRSASVGGITVTRVHR